MPIQQKRNYPMVATLVSRLSRGVTSKRMMLVGQSGCVTLSNVYSLLLDR